MRGCKNMPIIENKKGTIRQYIELKNCTLCSKEFEKKEKFRVVEEDGLFDNNWYAICYSCMSTKKYLDFIKSNCNLTPPLGE